jgi:hypothetical protein
MRQSPVVAGIMMAASLPRLLRQGWAEGCGILTANNPAANGDRSGFHQSSGGVIYFYISANVGLY